MGGGFLEGNLGIVDPADPAMQHRARQGGDDFAGRLGSGLGDGDDGDLARLHTHAFPLLCTRIIAK